jgi:hypothetical protein
MSEYIVNLAGFGIDDDTIASLDNKGLQIKKRGDVWNSRTGKKYPENIISISCDTSYEKGFGPIIDEIINKLKSSQSLLDTFEKCNYVELQIWASLDVDYHVPSIHISLEQMKFLAKINANIDIDIY